MQSVTSPLWLDLLKAIIGPVIAAVVFIVGLIWRDRIERRNAAQAWFEQTYITDGIDLLFGQLAALRAALNDLRYVSLERSLAPMPAHILHRFVVLLEIHPFLSGCLLVDSIVLSAMRTKTPIALTAEEVEELDSYCRELLGIAESLRLILLRAKVTSKTAVYDIGKNKKVTADVKNVLQPLQEGEDTLETINNRLRNKFLGRMEAASQLSEKSNP